MNSLNLLQGRKITIRFTNRSRSQNFKCTLGATDGRNSIIYCEEGAPELIGNNYFEVIKEGWQV